MQSAKPQGFDTKLELIQRILEIRADFRVLARELEDLSGRPVPELPAFRWVDYLTSEDADYAVAELIEQYQVDLRLADIGAVPAVTGDASAVVDKHC